MATEKVGVYRRYYGPVPTDAAGDPLPKSAWPGKRGCSWAVRWFGANGNRYSKSFKTRREAERFAETKQIEVRDGRGDPPKRCTLRQFFEEHRTLSKGSLRRGSLIVHLSALGEFAKVFGWEHDMRQTRPIDVEKFRSQRSGQVGSPNTVNKEIRTLRRLYNLAISRHYRAKGTNPCDGVALLKVAVKRPAYLSPDQFEKVYGLANLLDRVLLVVLYTSALRLGEAMHLRWDDVEFQARMLHVTPKEADGYVQLWEPKDHERREVPLPPQAIDLLQQWRVQAPRDCPYVFMDGPRWNYYRQQVNAGRWKPTTDLFNNTLRKFQSRCRRAGVGHYTLHDLRRSSITNWARMGLPIHVVQHLAGHADIRTTQRHYLSVQEDDLAAAREAQRQVTQKLEQVPLPKMSSGSTDPKLTHKGQNGWSLRRKVFPDATQLPPEAEVA